MEGRPRERVARLFIATDHVLPVVASDAALELPGATEHPGYPLALGQPQQPRVELSTTLGYRGPLDHAGAAAIAFLLNDRTASPTVR